MCVLNSTLYEANYYYRYFLSMVEIVQYSFKYSRGGVTALMLKLKYLKSFGRTCEAQSKRRNMYCSEASFIVGNHISNCYVLCHFDYRYVTSQKFKQKNFQVYEAVYPVCSWVWTKQIENVVTRQKGKEKNSQQKEQK